MPTSQAPDTSARLTSSSRTAAAFCTDCGARLSAGACPACALNLLMGSGPACEEAAELRVEENVEFGRYTLKQKLAAGGMGVVYLAEDKKLKRTVALKMIRGSTFADDGEVARFTLEAEAAAGLDHPHIVPIYEVGRLDGQPFFTMKFIEGQTLAQRLREHGGNLPAREVAALLSKIARAVHHAHQRGVLHRDLKPGNILLDGEGVPWLTDFGLAKVANTDSGLTLTKDHIGTPHYMAPEVAGGNSRSVSTASDVWALGVMLWEMLCGMPPFHGPGPVEIMRRIVSEEPSWPHGTRADGDLVTIARRCMEKNPARRPQSAGELADELDRWLRGEPIKARPVTRRERFVKWVRREPAMAALYAVLLLAMSTGLLLWHRAEDAVVSLTETNGRLENMNTRLADALCIATATKIAGDAKLQVEEDSTRALLLAVESVEMSEPSGVLPEAASALTAVLQQVGGLDATAGGSNRSINDAYIAASDADLLVAQASPDGRWLVTIDFNEFNSKGITAALFDLTARHDSIPLRRWLLWPARVKELLLNVDWCWMPDSRRILAIGQDGVVRAWDVVSADLRAGETVPEPPPSRPLGALAREGMVLRVAKLRRPGPSRPPGVACVYQRDSDPPEIFPGWTEIGEDESLRPGELRGVNRPWMERGVHCQVSPDGRWMLLGLDNMEAEMIVKDLTLPDQPALRLPGPAGMIRRSAFSEDGRLLAIRREDQQTLLFTLPERGSSEEIVSREVATHSGEGESLCISPDNRWVVATGRTGRISLQPVSEGTEPLHLQLSAGNGRTVAFSSDGRWLAAGGDRRVVNLWRMEGLQSSLPPMELRGMPAAVLNVKFAPDNRTILASGSEHVCRRWSFDNVTAAALPQHLPSPGVSVPEVAVSPDEKWLVSACEAPPAAAAGESGGIVALSRIDGPERLVLGNHGPQTTGVAFSRDGRWIASTGRDGMVKVWDAGACTAAAAKGGRAPRPRFLLPMEGTRLEYSRHVSFHPRGTLYCACGDGVLFEWDLTREDPAASRQDHLVHTINYLLPDLMISPDGRWMAICRHGWDHEPLPGQRQFGNQVLLYDVSEPGPPVPVTELRATFIGISNLAFSADSRWLACGSAGAGPVVWDLTAPNIAATARTAPVTAHLISGVAFSPDGQRLAIGGVDGRLGLWDWRQPADLRTIHAGHEILALAWLRDGRLLAAGNSRNITVWETDVQRLKTLARRIAGRSLTTAERLRFRLQAR